MTVTEYMYLGSIVLAALIFYKRGFRTGARQTRKIWKGILEKTAPVEELPPLETELPKPPPQPVLVRGSRAFFPQSTIRGVFGKN